MKELREAWSGLIIPLIVMVIAVGLVSPAYAAAGDAKLTVFDATTSTTLVVCTTSISPCTITQVAGHSYSYTTQEVSNASTDDMAIEPIHNGVPGDFTGHLQAHGWVEPPVGDPCVVYDNSTMWQITCHSGGIDGRAIYATLQGVATSSADGFALARVTQAGVTRTARVNYSTP